MSCAINRLLMAALSLVLIRRLATPKRTSLGGPLHTKSQRANGGPLGEAISAVARRVGARRAEHRRELRVEARGTKDLHVRVGETVRRYAHHGVAREVAGTGRRGAERIAEVLDPRPAARTAGHVAAVLERVVAGSSAPRAVIARVVALHDIAIVEIARIAEDRHVRVGEVIGDSGEAGTDFHLHADRRGAGEALVLKHYHAEVAVVGQRAPGVVPGRRHEDGSPIPRAEGTLRAGLGPGGVRQAAVIRRNEYPVGKEALGHRVEQAVRGGHNYPIVDDRGRALKIAHARLGEEQLPCGLVGIGSDGRPRRDAGAREVEASRAGNLGGNFAILEEHSLLCRLPAVGRPVTWTG